MIEKTKEQLLAEKQALLPELKKAIDFWFDKTYDESAFYSHMITIVMDASADAIKHKEQLERLMWKVSELQDMQAKYWGGHKNLLGECKRLEKELIIKVNHLLTNGYSIDRFTIPAPTQTTLL